MPGGVAVPARRTRVLGVRSVPVERSGETRDDWVVVEEPLEIRVDGEPLAVTMRTPGQDVELALGFLYSEGLISQRSDVASVDASLEQRGAPEGPEGNTVAIELSPAARGRYATRRRELRAFPATSACGVCGKPSLEDLWQRVPALEPVRSSDDELAVLVRRLPERLRETQVLFEATGGIHAAALFALDGSLVALREDVGRHNAIDKLIGAALLDQRLPLHQHVLLTSGRAGYEIVQKALAAAVPVVAALGAASSLALEVAAWGGVAVYSFVRAEGANRHLAATDRRQE